MRYSHGAAEAQTPPVATGPVYLMSDSSSAAAVAATATPEPSPVVPDTSHTEEARDTEPAPSATQTDLGRLAGCEAPRRADV